MRLPWVLAVLLVLFVALGFYAERRMRAGAREMTREIVSAGAQLRAGNQRAALATLRRFEHSWARVEKVWSLVTDHHELDQIHLSIGRTEQLLRHGKTAEAQAELSALLFLIGHIPPKESLGFNTVF